MIAANTHRDGIRKAAILVGSLDPITADRLLDQLDAETAELVRAMAAGANQYDIEERRRILDEFRRIGPLVPEKFPAGIELDGPMTGQFAPPARSQVVDPERSGPVANGIQEQRLPFEFLREVDVDQLLRLLSGERRQTVALVLSHLSPELGGNVLAKLPAAERVEIVRRLAELNGSDPETLWEIEQSLEARLTRLREIERCRIAGPEAAAKILASCDGDVADDILENIAVEDELLAERLGRKTLAFNDIVQLSDAEIIALLRATTPLVVQAALFGANAELLERILCCLPADAAKNMQRKLKCFGPIRLSDVDAARQLLASQAMRVVRNRTRAAA
jgi:flagellar motor switch protein FliG